MSSSSTSPRSIPNVLSIAGVDPSGGAGIFADIKTFSALGAYGCGVIAALTAQNTQAVTGVHVPPTDFLRLQLDTLFADVAVHATKIGMLGSAEVTATVADRLAHWQAKNVVLDPVMVAKSGDTLLAKNAIAMMREALFPQSFMITPNLPEAGVLLEQRAPESVKEMYRAAERLRELLPLSSERWVMLKGGHLPSSEVVDLLFDGDRMIELPAPRIDTKNTHGTGCTLSSAIAALLPQAAGAQWGALRPVEAAVRQARQWLLGAIAHSGELAVGSGHGPVHHFHALWRR
ncbi:bifunctional hydroxymethylpyrimidine kinase/phosphomethylpyrimidine kinase [Azoarcus sp. DD4]|uniref:bifunctional hydroxymethylpyrimidine kinase/phosphomethylpyrimidine kinase n=1 Tax=Azoarcus sp. DD4 TaxID=2027405 RepID=UPI0011261384|nr:bifunctional hydroxymethylpyrimidine kinase/phosphomethylpyrimidine kinase [Azoarcus sp. DD4]QDF95964.1 bifunctional hydroxymethylpyrimidine kinase/phosphomethylpyrimidine kinase [Azoarcus sp. DD4]